MDLRHFGQGDNVAGNKNIIQRVFNINPKTADELVTWVILVVALVVIFFFTPGILIASFIDKVAPINGRGSWGISIIASVSLALLLRYKYKDLGLRIYFFLSIFSASIILMGYLFIGYPMQVRTLMKMLDMEENIPAEFIQSSANGGFVMGSIFSFAPKIKPEPNLLIGQWKADKAFMTFDENGNLTYKWYSNGLDSIGKWELMDDILFTYFKDDTIGYKVRFISKDKFTFQSGESTYTAIKMLE